MMKPKELKEHLQHYYRRSIARFCTEPRAFEEIIDHMMEKVGWNHNLAYVLVAEHLGLLEKARAVRSVEGKWVVTEAAADALRRYF